MSSVNQNVEFGSPSGDVVFAAADSSVNNVEQEPDADPVDSLPNESVADAFARLANVNARSPDGLTNCSNVASPGTLPFCAFSHTPAIDSVLESFSIRRCTPSEVGVSALNGVCSADSHIITGLSACRSGSTAIPQCLDAETPLNYQTLQYRLKLDNTLPSGAKSTLNPGNYVVPKITLPANVLMLLDMQLPDTTTPHFRGLWRTLIESNRELLSAARKSCITRNIMEDPEIIPKIAIFEYLIQIISYCEMFHDLPLNRITSTDIVSMIAREVRTKFRDRFTTRPTVNMRWFSPATTLNNQIVRGTSAPTIDNSTKVISGVVINAGELIVMKGKSEDLVEFISTASPVMNINTRCNNVPIVTPFRPTQTPTFRFNNNFN